MEWLVEMYETYHAFADTHFEVAVAFNLVVLLALIIGAVVVVGLLDRSAARKARRAEKRALETLRQKAMKPKRGW